jgi:uncharacterized membrane protein YbaN (DUF454 family)
MSGRSESNGRPKSKSKVVRALWIIAGSISLGLGIIGIVLPVLPTTPFLLLSAYCYDRGSERLHEWLMNNRVFGEYIRNYSEGRGIPMRAKVTAIVSLWVMIGVSAYFFMPWIEVRLILLIIAIGVTVHLVRLPTYRKGQ